MRNLILLLFLFSISSHAKHPLSGLWEGYEYNINAYDSHILELDKNGVGFYSLALSGMLDKQSVFPINPNNFKYTDGFYKLVVNKNEDITVTLLVSEDMGHNLNVLTIVRGPNGKVGFSYSWILSLVRGNLQNERLYNFSKEHYNKALKTDS
jgi:hypothetical protein